MMMMMMMMMTMTTTIEMEDHCVKKDPQIRVVMSSFRFRGNEIFPRVIMYEKCKEAHFTDVGRKSCERCGVWA